MKILLNNRIEEFACDAVTVSRMLELKKYSFRLRIIKINGNLIRKEDYDTSVINDGDNVQMIYQIGRAHV